VLGDRPSGLRAMWPWLCAGVCPGVVVVCAGAPLSVRIFVLGENSLRPLREMAGAGIEGEVSALLPVQPCCDEWSECGWREACMGSLYP